MDRWMDGWEIGNNGSSRKPKRMHMWIDWMKRRNEFWCLMEYYFFTCFITLATQLLEQKILEKKVIFRKSWKWQFSFLFVFIFCYFFPHNEMVSISNSFMMMMMMIIIIIIIIPIGISTKDLTRQISMDKQNKDDWQNTILSTKIRPKIKDK